ncbi:MAG: NAD-dependent epimerase/dehydratase family protein, partial [Clostridia bacterium]|nr:NAD-dependent epimerase/dehydratase family protein [Clostridia bacterium]
IKDFNTCLEATKGVSYVLNQAAWGSVPRSIEMPVFYCNNNILGTVNMMEASRQNGVKTFVYASSSSVYGDEPNLPKTEGREGNLLSPYALTKMADELWAKQYTKHYGLPTVGLRYFNVFGRRQDPNGAYAAVIPKFIMQLMKGETPTINGDGKQSRDFTYIENVIEANLKACLAPEEAFGEAFNIAYGGREYLIDIYYGLTKALGVDKEPNFGPDRKGDIKHSNADISKAKRLLGYDPEWSFKRGIEAAIEWYKNNL